MLNRKAFIGIVAVMCCSQTALGAASVRSSGMQNTSVTPARAGSVRIAPTKTVSAATSGTSVSAPVEAPTVGRMATSSGGTVGTKLGKVGKQASGASSAALADLERTVNELVDKYNLLDSQYAQLYLGISDATATALNAKSASDANTERIALKMNSTDFNTKFDSRAETTDLANKSFVQSYVSENAPTPDLSGYYTGAEVERRLAAKIGAGDDFNSAFDSRLERKGIESNVNNLAARVSNAETKITAIEENPGVNTAAVNGLVNTKIEGLRAEVTADLSNTLASANAYTDAHKGMNASEQAAFNTLSGNVTTLATQMDSKLSKTEASSTYSTKEELANAVIGGQVDLSDYARTGTVNSLAQRVSSAETAIQNNTAALSGKADASAVNASIASINNELAGKVGEDRVAEMIDNANVGGDVNLANYYDRTETNSLLSGKVDTGTVYTKTESNTTFATKDENAAMLATAKAYTDEKVGAISIPASGADLSNYYTKSIVDGLLAEKADAGTVTTALENMNASLNNKADTVTVNAALANKANASDVDTLSATVTELAATVEGKLDAGDLDNYYDKDTVDAKLLQAASGLDEGEVNTLINAAVGTNYYNKDTVDSLLSAKADTSAVYTTTQADNKFATTATVNDLAAQVSSNTENIATMGTAVGSLQENVSSHGTAITGLQSDMSTKANASAVYTTTQADDKFVTKTDFQTSEATLSAAISTAQATAIDTAKSYADGLAISGLCQGQQAVVTPSQRDGYTVFTVSCP